jgi:ubiquitin-like modifier-activating enzyme ATG7
LNTRLSGSETELLVDSVQTWRYRTDHRQHGFFLAKRSRSEHSESASAVSWKIGALGDFENGFFENTAESDRFVAFSDPSTYPDYPGWPLRNLLVLIQERWKLDKVQILCYRDIQSERDNPRSLILNLQLDGERKATSDVVPRVTGWERNSEKKLNSKIASLSEHMDPRR